MNLALRGNVAIITGAGAGIGRAAAIELAREGCDLVLGSRSEERLARVAHECASLGVKVRVVVADLVSPEACQRLVDVAASELGGVDVLVTGVGSTPIGDFDQLDDTAWQRSFDTKFMSTVRAVRAALPELRRRGSGRIVLVAGNAAQMPSQWMMTSGALNSALCNLASSLSRQLAPENIGVNAVCPGPTKTDRYEALKDAVAKREGISLQEASIKISSSIPRGRPARPEDVGSLVAYLASSVSAHITGTVVVIDGGQS